MCHFQTWVFISLCADDGSVVVEYSQGTSACSSGRRRSNNPQARTRIVLTCGHTVGAPVLTDAIAWVDCTIHEVADSGTHNIYIGKVVASDVPRPDEQPLVYWNRGYRQLAVG